MWDAFENWITDADRLICSWKCHLYLCLSCSSLCSLMLTNFFIFFVQQHKLQCFTWHMHLGICSFIF